MTRIKPLLSIEQFIVNHKGIVIGGTFFLCLTGSSLMKKADTSSCVLSTINSQLQIAQLPMK
jgi:hypothetical protein